MSNLSEVKINDILPSSIAADQNVQELSETADRYMHNIYEKLQCILLLPNLDTLPEDVVDSLAWQYHVDFYEMDMDIAKKRNMVREAIYWHLIKGTPAAVEKVVTAVFDSAVVQENWEYGGRPYWFRVTGITEPLTDADTIQRLTNAINSAKNTRSWCEGIGFRREIDQTVYVGTPILHHKKIVVYPSNFRMPDIDTPVHTGIPVKVHRKVVISNA